MERHRLGVVVVAHRVHNRAERYRLVRIIHDRHEGLEIQRRRADWEQIFAEDPVRITGVTSLEQDCADHGVPNVVGGNRISIRKSHPRADVERIRLEIAGDAVSHRGHGIRDVREPARRAAAVIDEQGRLGVDDDLEACRLVVDLRVEGERAARRVHDLRNDAGVRHIARCRLEGPAPDGEGLTDGDRVCVDRRRVREARVRRHIVPLCGQRLRGPEGE